MNWPTFLKIWFEMFSQMNYLNNTFSLFQVEDNLRADLLNYTASEGYEVPSWFI
jgi:hypothetical protein